MNDRETRNVRRIVYCAIDMGEKNEEVDETTTEWVQSFSEDKVQNVARDMLVNILPTLSNEKRRRAMIAVMLRMIENRSAQLMFTVLALLCFRFQSCGFHSEIEYVILQFTNEGRSAYGNPYSVWMTICYRAGICPPLTQQAVSSTSSWCGSGEEYAWVVKLLFPQDFLTKLVKDRKVNEMRAVVAYAAALLEEYGVQQAIVDEIFESYLLKHAYIKRSNRKEEYMTEADIGVCDGINCPYDLPLCAFMKFWNANPSSEVHLKRASTGNLRELVMKKMRLELMPVAISPSRRYELLVKAFAIPWPEPQWYGRMPVLKYETDFNDDDKDIWERRS